MNHETQISHSTNQFLWPSTQTLIAMSSSSLNIKKKKKSFLTDLRLIEEGAKIRSKVYNSSHVTSHRGHDKSLSNLERHREGRLGVAVNHLFQY